MDHLPEDLSGRLRTVSRSLNDLRRSIPRRPKPRRYPLYLLAAALLWGAIIAGALLAQSSKPVLAPSHPDDLPLDSRGWPKYPGRP